MKNDVQLDKQKWPDYYKYSLTPKWTDTKLEIIYMWHEKLLADQVFSPITKMKTIEKRD